MSFNLIQALMGGQKTLKSQEFNSAAGTFSFTVPDNVNMVFLTLVGGGGGGDAGGTNGTASSFGSYATVAGGTKAAGAGGDENGVIRYNRDNANTVITAEYGIVYFDPTSKFMRYPGQRGGVNGVSSPAWGGSSAINGFGAGGTGSATGTNGTPGGSAGGAIINEPVSVVPGETITVTIGAGGAAGAPGSGMTPGPGQRGYCCVKWFE